MGQKNIGQQKNDTSIELFSTPEGIRTVDSPIRLKILSMLREHEMSADELVAMVGTDLRAVQSNLKGLEDERIIRSRYAGNKPLFFIDSGYLGGLSRKDRFGIDLKDYISKSVSGPIDPLNFFRLMLRTIRVSLMNEGIDLDPLLHEAGVSMGEALYGRLADPDLEAFLGNIADFWEEQKLGRVEVKTLDPLVIEVFDCYECQYLPYTGKPGCAFDSGLLRAAFSAYFDREMVAEEFTCLTMGDSCCSFLIRGKNGDIR